MYAYGARVRNEGRLCTDTAYMYGISVQRPVHEADMRTRNPEKRAETDFRMGGEARRFLDAFMTWENKEIP